VQEKAQVKGNGSGKGNSSGNGSSGAARPAHTTQSNLLSFNLRSNVLQ